MLQEIILQRKLQKALWCGRGVCPSIHERWAGLRDEIITHTQEEKVAGVVEAITHLQHNLFGYPNEERGLWLEFETNGLRQYGEKKKANSVYFVGCRASFLISLQHQAVAMLRELAKSEIDVAVLNSGEWCCGMPLKKLGMADEFQRHLAHNLKEIYRLEAKQVIFNCYSCYSVWQEEYKLEGLELVYKESIN